MRGIRNITSNVCVLSYCVCVSSLLLLCVRACVCVRVCDAYQASFHLEGLDFDCLHRLIQKLLLLILGRLGSRLEEIEGILT